MWCVISCTELAKLEEEEAEAEEELAEGIHDYHLHDGIYLTFSISPLCSLTIVEEHFLV